MKIPHHEVAGMIVDPSVLTKLKELPEDSRVLRVAVLGGGCSGFQYDIGVSAPEEGDSVLEVDGVSVVVDEVSQPFLAGARLVYAHELVGSRFTIDNPNTSSSCGCGLSFSM